MTGIGPSSLRLSAFTGDNPTYFMRPLRSMRLNLLKSQTTKDPPRSVQRLERFERLFESPVRWIANPDPRLHHGNDFRKDKTSRTEMR
jgi:hypothetical protein